jgi:hypothetical protein
MFVASSLANLGPTPISITGVGGRSVEDLPSGFERKFNSDGRPFYVDHNTRTTHWTPPPSHSSSASAPQAVTREEDLPPSFELKFNSHGQPYYVDHNTLTSARYISKHAARSCTPSLITGQGGDCVNRLSLVVNRQIRRRQMLPM